MSTSDSPVFNAKHYAAQLKAEADREALTESAGSPSDFREGLDAPVGSFRWKIVQALEGDRECAWEVLQSACVALSPEALAQNEGLIDPQMAQVIADEIVPWARGELGPMLSVLKRKRGEHERAIDSAKHKSENGGFWFAVKVLRHCAHTGASHYGAIVSIVTPDPMRKEVQDGWAGVGGVQSARKAFERWRDAAELHERYAARHPESLTITGAQQAASSKRGAREVEAAQLSDEWHTQAEARLAEHRAICGPTCPCGYYGK
ncbi:MAG TPA: hypothetical protein VKM35_11500 [Arenimonas sp.]|uniref:hypothetical protein n=1 Tax=Arenimonas sp. TaxID=1872635 RepID=UPI002B5EB0C5|nr:hypothetical protein [Arenimonas sp.]HMB57817.1 hypothetical protein [Arenimonas sp.]